VLVDEGHDGEPARGAQAFTEGLSHPTGAADNSQ